MSEERGERIGRIGGIGRIFFGGEENAARGPVNFANCSFLVCAVGGGVERCKSHFDLDDLFDVTRAKRRIEWIESLKVTTN